MNTEYQGILAQPKKPGPIERAVVAGGIASALPQQRTAQPAQTTATSIAADPFAYRGGPKPGELKGPVNGPDSTALDPVAQGIGGGIAQPGKVSAAPVPPVQGIAGGMSGIMAGMGSEGGAPPVIRQIVGDHAPSLNTQAGIAGGLPAGRDVQGVITAESATAAMGSPMTRPGGIAGTYDGKGVNEILARENQARGEMIDKMIEAQGGNGAAILEPSPGPQIERGIMADMPRGLSPRQQASFLNEQSKIAASMRGNDPQSAAARQRIGNLIADALAIERATGQQIRNQQAQRLNDLQQQLVAEVDPNRRQGIAGQIKALSGRTEAPAGGDRLTLPQRRSNFEIDAARERIAGLAPDEIKRKTANHTATGRENPEYDPTLAKAVALANRRKYGADDQFDQTQQAPQAEGNDGDVMTRFRADQAMRGHKLGKQTEQGLEVFDAAGQLIGHYR